MSQTATTETIGWTKISCLANSDTVVGVPFRSMGSLKTSMVSPPVVAGDSVTLTFSAGVFAAGELSSHYLKFIDGDRAGRWYDIQTTSEGGTPNTTNTVTISLNGDTIGNVTTGNNVIIAQYWTLNTLFPPSGATTAWSGSPPVQNGHAIVASTSLLSSGRRTELLLPDLSSVGTNIAPNKVYFILNGVWRQRNDSTNSNFGSIALNPNAYFIVRHSSSVTTSTTFRSVGEVETGSFGIPLSTHSTLYQDNAISLPRPVNVAINDLGLVPQAFVASTSSLTSGRKDELLVFNNDVSAFNKSPDRVYYYLNAAWRKRGQSSTTDFGNDQIPAGGGFLIRKAPVASGATSFWNNPPNYVITP